MNEGGSTVDVEAGRYANDLWKRCEQLLLSSNSRFVRIDAIANMKRAIDCRRKDLKKMYAFKKLKTVEGDLEILRKFGIVRPLMLKQLYALRNAIEHQAKKPPVRSRCLECLDFTWYFLRSTDWMVRKRINNVELCFEGDINSPYGVTLDTDFEFLWKLPIGGWIPGKYASLRSRAGWLEIDAEVAQTRKERNGRNRKLSTMHGQGRQDDLIVKGIIIGPSTSLMKVISKYFSLY